MSDDCEEDKYPYYQSTRMEFLPQRNEISTNYTKLCLFTGEVFTRLVLKSTLSEVFASEYFIHPDPNIMNILPNITDSSMRRKIISDSNNIFRKCIVELYENSRTVQFSAIVKLKDTIIYFRSGGKFDISIVNCPGDLITLVRQECPQTVSEDDSGNAFTIKSSDPVANGILIDYICNEFSQTLSAVGHIWSSVSFVNGMLQRVHATERNGYIELNGIIFADLLKTVVPADIEVVDYRRFS